MRTRVSLLTALVAVTTCAAWLGATSASATPEPLCYGATVSTFATGTTTVGPYCVPFPGPVDCFPAGTGVGTLFAVTALACLPAPLGVSSPGA